MSTSRARRLVGAAAGLLLLAGVVGAVVVDDEADPVPYVEATCPAGPLPAAGTGAVMASAQGGGVQLRVTIGPEATRVCEVVSAAVRVTNTGRTPVLLYGQCGAAYARVVVDVGAGPVTRSDVTGLLVPSSEVFLAPGAPRSCQPSETLLAAGASVSERLEWLAMSPNGATYDGDVQVSAQLGFRAPGTRSYRDVRTSRVALSMTGGQPGRLTLQEALERALADRAFASQLREAGGFSSSSDGVRFQPGSDLVRQASDDAFRVSFTRTRSRYDVESVSVSVDPVSGDVGEVRTGRVIID